MGSAWRGANQFQDRCAGTTTVKEIVETLLHNWIALVVLIGCVSGVITAIAAELRKYGSHRHEVDLKRELVERGLSVEEIERIIAARPAKNKER
jgi:hypothetical protein